MLRRSFLAMMGAAVLPAAAHGQNPAINPAAGRIAILRDLVDALGAAGDAIAKLTDGFKHLVVTGAAGYDYVAAERERARLIDISRRMANLLAAQSIRVVQSLDDYLDEPAPTEADWQRVIRNLDGTLVSVRELLAAVQAEKGEFVLEPAYLALNRALNERDSVLRKLAAISAPATAQEREALRRASARYRVLIANAEAAVGELNAYVKARQ